VKIRAKSVKTFAKSLNIWANSLKLLAKPAPNMLSFEKNVFFGQVWGTSGKNPSHPQKFACSYTYASPYYPFY